MTSRGRRAVVTLLIAGMSSLAFSSDEHTSLLTACSVFAQDGYSATAIVEQDAVLLDVANPSGQTVSHLSIPRHHPTPFSSSPAVRGDRGRCGLFINRARDLVAVGVVQAIGHPKSPPLQVVIAELKSAKVVADFTVEPSVGFLPTSVAGFLEDTNNIVVTGRITGQEGVRQRTIRVASLLFDTAGKQLSSTPVNREASPSDAFNDYADAQHNRLWLFSCWLTQAKPYHVPICPVALTTLVGDDQARIDFDPTSHVQKRDDLWMWPGAFAGLSGDSILIAETVDGKDGLWKVNMQDQTLDRFVLPKGHWVKYNGVKQASLSPDGEVLALLIDQIKLGFPYFVDNYQFKGTDVLVMQLHPFRLLARIPHTDSTLTTGLAVDHRLGKVFILLYRRGHVERISLSERAE